MNYEILIDNIEFTIDKGGDWFSIYRGNRFECIFSDDNLDINSIPEFNGLKIIDDIYIEWRKKELIQYGEYYKKIKALLILI